MVDALNTLAAILLLPFVCLAGASITDTSASPNAKLQAAGLDEVRWTGGLMGERFDTCRNVMVPSMWHLMEGAEPTQFFENFRIAAGISQGRHRGAKYNDGDFYKWLESAAAVYAATKDESLDRQLDGIIDVIAKAQRSDGYIHTATLIAEKQGGDAKPFANPLDFEMYNMGHLMTAACVHYRATGKTSLLQVARKAADFLGVTFEHPTPELARNEICPAHYMGLVELYRATHEKKYLELAQRLIDMRSLIKDGTDDNQDRIPFRQQTTAMGHAVRANYLYAGAADVFLETGDKTLLDPLERIWQDVVSHKLYITGGCGALYDGASPDGSSDQKSITRTHQAYGRDFQLPNTTAHNESCAAIGSLLWNWRMLQITGDAKFADVIEQTLYNSVLESVSQDGKNFFYTNALRSLDPMPVTLRWSRTRQSFMNVFCCPPNVVRTIAESAGYAYGKSDRGIWVNLYGSSIFATHLADGSTVQLKQETNYPWDGKIRIKVDVPQQKEFSLMLRVPGWVHQATALVNGQPIAQPSAAGNYSEIRRPWSSGDVVQLDFAMPAHLLEANPFVEETRNQVAVMRGPIVYCLESTDLPAGVRVLDVRIPRDIQLDSKWAADVVGGTMLVTGKAMASTSPDWSGKLYRDVTSTTDREIDLKLIPYFDWNNRGKSEMTVWLSAGR